MKDINHKISHKIVNYAHTQGVATIRVEFLKGIRQGTTRTSHRASAQKNHRITKSWTYYQLTQFIIYKAATRLGIKVEMVDPAHTCQECSARKHRNSADDHAYECHYCGWKGHRDIVGAIKSSRRTSLDSNSQSAIGAMSLLNSWKANWNSLIWQATIPKVKAIEDELNQNPLAKATGKFLLCIDGMSGTI